MTKELTNTEDIIDSRDIIARIEELESMEPRDEDEETELKGLKALAEEAEGCADWPYGETLIRDSYFVEYAEQLAEDIGAINRDSTWPNDCIDWDRAAEQLQMDYTSVDFDGVIYWLRS